MSPQETEEEDEQEEQESPRRRRSFQESLSLPLPACYSGKGQKDDPSVAKDGSRCKSELSSSPSLSPSLGDSIESTGSPSLSSPKDTTSPQSPSEPASSVKKRESKGKSKEIKGMHGCNIRTFSSIATETNNYCFFPEESNEPSPAGKPKRRFPDFGWVSTVITVIS